MKVLVVVACAMCAMLSTVDAQAYRGVWNFDSNEEDNYDSMYGYYDEVENNEDYNDYEDYDDYDEEVGWGGWGGKCHCRCSTGAWIPGPRCKHCKPCPRMDPRMPGRPFRVNGKVILVPLKTEVDGNNSYVHHWIKSAKGEHASVASFADLSLKLFQLGAPLTLLERTAKAQLDEVRHATIMLGLVQQATNTSTNLAFGKAKMGSYAGTAGVTMETVLLESLEDGCINEGLAATVAGFIKNATKDASVKAAYEIINRDESRHSDLAWDIVKWILAEQPKLKEVASKSYYMYESQALTNERNPYAAMVSDEIWTQVKSHVFSSNRERLAKMLN